MANSFFSIPNIHFGENAVAALQRLNSKKVAIITDDFMVASGLIHRHRSNWNDNAITDHSSPGLRTLTLNEAMALGQYG